MVPTIAVAESRRRIRDVEWSDKHANTENRKWRVLHQFSRAECRASGCSKPYITVDDILYERILAHSYPAKLQVCFQMRAYKYIIVTIYKPLYMATAKGLDLFGKR